MIPDAEPAATHSRWRDDGDRLNPVERSTLNVQGRIAEERPKGLGTHIAA